MNVRKYIILLLSFSCIPVYPQHFLEKHKHIISAVAVFSLSCCIGHAVLQAHHRTLYPKELERNVTDFFIDLTQHEMLLQKSFLPESRTLYEEFKERHAKECEQNTIIKKISNNPWWFNFNRKRIITDIEKLEQSINKECFIYIDSTRFDFLSKDKKIKSALQLEQKLSEKYKIIKEMRDNHDYYGSEGKNIYLKKKIRNFAFRKLLFLENVRNCLKNREYTLSRCYNQNEKKRVEYNFDIISLIQCISNNDQNIPYNVEIFSNFVKNLKAKTFIETYQTLCQSLINIQRRELCPLCTQYARRSTRNSCEQCTECSICCEKKGEFYGTYKKIKITTVYPLICRSDSLDEQEKKQETEFICNACFEKSKKSGNGCPFCCQGIELRENKIISGKSIEKTPKQYSPFEKEIQDFIMFNTPSLYIWFFLKGKNLTHKEILEIMEEAGVTLDEINKVSDEVNVNIECIKALKPDFFDSLDVYDYLITQTNSTHKKIISRLEAAGYSHHLIEKLEDPHIKKMRKLFRNKKPIMRIYLDFKKSTSTRHYYENFVNRIVHLSHEKIIEVMKRAELPQTIINTVDDKYLMEIAELLDNKHSLYDTIITIQHRYSHINIAEKLKTLGIAEDKIKKPYKDTYGHAADFYRVHYYYTIS